MAERKVQNKYYPPEYFEALERNGGGKGGASSLNAFRGQHPLRERARKLDQGILVVRFEMPFNVWCLKCERHIATGVRFNAEKKQVGNYFSSKIWSFRMKCPSCSNWMEMRTDPQISDYVCIEGCRRKIESWEEEGAQFLDPEEAQRIAKDPLYRLEHAEEDQIKARTLKPVLVSLQDLQQEKHDDYAISQMLRKRFREQKKEDLAKETASFHNGLQMHLVDEKDEDISMAKRIRFNPESALVTRAIIRSSSIFASEPKSATTTTNTAPSIPSSSSSSSSSSTHNLNGDKSDSAVSTKSSSFVDSHTRKQFLLKKVLVASARHHPSTPPQPVIHHRPSDSSSIRKSPTTTTTTTESELPAVSSSVEQQPPSKSALSLLNQYTT